MYIHISLDVLQSGPFRGKMQSSANILFLFLFYQHVLTLIPAWISNYIHYKMWDEITYPLKFRNGWYFIPHVTRQVII